MLYFFVSCVNVEGYTFLFQVLMLSLCSSYEPYKINSFLIYTGVVSLINL